MFYYYYRWQNEDNGPMYHTSCVSPEEPKLSEFLKDCLRRGIYIIVFDTLEEMNEHNKLVGLPPHEE